MVATGMKGEVLLTEILELDVWAAVARGMVAHKSKWMVCRRSVQWLWDWIKKVVVEMVVVVGEGMPMDVSWDRWVQVMAVVAAMWVEVVWQVVVVAWRERMATENACRARSYGAARRGSKRQRRSAELYCHVVVESLISGVDGEYVVRWCWM